MTGPGILIWSLPLGACADAILGDPHRWPHPVRALGALIKYVEHVIRRLFRVRELAPACESSPGYIARMERIAGVVLVVWVVGLTIVATGAILELAKAVGPLPCLITRSLLVFWGLAAGSLTHETRLAAEAGDLETARQDLAHIVGRDTASLDWPEIHRACVETVGENTNDGIVAPLFWYALGGPVGMWAYKAINTLDSMVGYRNDRYRYLGWAAARVDDVAGLIPARLTWLLFGIAALFLQGHAWGAIRIGWRDGRKHPSPNSGWGEAALAGALGVELGGISTYRGSPSARPLLGDAGRVPDRRDVAHAIRLMQMVAVTAVLLTWVFRAGLCRLP
jgi:adenosylcobinamide-phosphate synthase